VKICFFGNQGNNAYKHCKYLRELGHDAHLILFAGKETKRSNPEYIDKDLENGYPEWIFRYSTKQFLFNIIPRLDKEIKEKVNNDYDVVVVSGNFAMKLASTFSKKVPLVLLLTGSSNLGVVHKRSYLKRKTVKRSMMILGGGAFQVTLLKMINQHNKLHFHAQMEDIYANQESINEELLNKLIAQYKKYDKVFIWLSRSVVEKNDNAYKAPEVFIEAVEKFIKSNQKNIKVIMGAHGRDFPIVKEKIKNYDIEDHFDFVPHLRYRDVLTYLSLPNGVVFDSLRPDRLESISGILRDALSVGAVYVARINYDMLKMRHGPDCPIFDAKNSDEACQVMKTLCELDESEFQELQKKTLSWAEKYLHYKNQINRFENLLYQVYWRSILMNHYKFSIIAVYKSSLKAMQENLRAIRIRKKKR
jgi:hypothetical protein